MKHVFAALLIACAASSSAQEPGSALPKWMLELAQDGPHPTPADAEWHEDSRTWIRTTDGGRMLLLRSVQSRAELLVHKFDSRGVLEARSALRQESNPSFGWTGNLTLHPAHGGGAWLYWQESSLRHHLFRLASDGQLVTRALIIGAVAQIVPAATEGWLVLRQHSLERIDASGQSAWRIVRPNSRVEFQQMLERADGGIWIATRTVGSVRLAIDIRRYGPDQSWLGTTSLACDGCSFPSVGRLHPHPDGGAFMTGGSPTFLARLTPDAELAWMVRPAASGLTDLQVDSTGNLVAHSRQLDQFIGFDPATGAERWRLRAQLVVPDGAGAISVVYTASSRGHQFELQLTDGTGAITSRRGIGGPYLSSIAQAQFDESGTIEFLASQNRPPFEACAATPRLLRIEAGGSEAVTAGVCSVPLNTGASELRVDARNRSLIHTAYGIEARDERGRLRWRYQPCPGCSADPSVRTGFSIWQWVVTDDGGAWTLEAKRPRAYASPSEFRLVRLDPIGRIASEIDVTTLPSGVGSDRYLRAGRQNGAIMLWSNPSRTWQWLGWSNFDRRGEVSTGSIPLGNEFYAPGVKDFQVLPDGDLLVSIDPMDGMICFPPHCFPVFLTVLRLSPFGDLRWLTRTEVEDADFVALGASGDSLLVRSSNGWPHQAQSLGPDGARRALLDLPALGPGDWLYSAHVLERDHAVVVSKLGLQRFDVRTGQVLDTEALAPGVYLEASSLSPLGLLLDPYGLTGAAGIDLVDPETFSTRLRTRVDLPPDQRGAHSNGYAATASQDGAVVLLHAEDHDDGRQSRYLALYALPGSAVEHRLFRDGLEP
jgi:hypothetical protein